MIATTTSAGMLSQPIPDGRSDRYAAGWAFADVHIRKGGSLTADAPTDWHEEKVAGFSDRLVTERAALARRLRTHCSCGEELELSNQRFSQLGKLAMPEMLGWILPGLRLSTGLQRSMHRLPRGTRRRCK